ncbi:hypothetical protein BAL199_19528 [alpha proteobacterium BAL199]|nr:hypothetical protein BAL199_19528 [alpha proteobacterium BAL199]
MWTLRATHDKIAAMANPVIDARGLSAVAVAVVSWGVLIVVSRVLVVGFDLNPWVLSFIQMAVGGAAMFVAAGRGPLPLTAMRNPHTWIYGGLRVLTAATLTAALAHGTAAEISVMSAFFIPVGILLAWTLFARRPSSADVIGSLVILAGIVGVADGLPGGLGGPVVVLMAISATATAVATAVAELHPDNRNDDRKGRLRLTGAAMLTTAVLMLGVAAAVAYFETDGAVAEHVPFDAVTHPAIWIAGILVGVILRGPSTYATFRAIRMVGSENYLMGVALMPVMNLIGESLAATAGLLPMPALSSATMLAGAVGIAGAMGMVALRWRARARSVQSA